MASASISELSSDVIAFPRVADEGAQLGDLCQHLGIIFARNLPLEWVDQGKLALPRMIMCDRETYIKAQVRKVFKMPRYKAVAHLEERVTEIALEHLSQVKFNGIPNDSARPWREEMEIWESTLVHRAQLAMMRGAGWEAIDLSYAERVPTLNLSNSIQLISCFEFALMRAGAEEMLPLDCTVQDLMGNLRKYGFVSIAEPKNGDLVVFCSDGLPIHMGIMYKNKVLSKPGNAQKFAFVHKLEEASDHYGNEVVYLRRSILN